MARRKICLIVEFIVVFVFLLFVVDFSGVTKHLLELDFRSTFHYPMHGNVLRYAHQLRFNKLANVPATNTYNYTILHNCAHKCSGKQAGAPRVTILIKSAINHFERRVIIRKTWGSEYERSNQVRSVFLLGNSNDVALEKLVQDESNQYKDILMADFIDSYYNNTIKTMMGFRWVVEYCPNSTHYLFVDDDYYVSIKNVLRFIRSPMAYPMSTSNMPNSWPSKDNDLNNIDSTHFEQQNRLHFKEDADSFTLNASKWQNFKSKNLINNFPLVEQSSTISMKLYAGFLLNSSPHRHKLSKWYVALSEYPFDMWPPYITAGAYILSQEALFEMYFVSFYTKNFRFDDVYLSILAFKAGINATHCSNFYFQKAKYLEPRSYRNVIASHGYGDPTKLLNTWLECYTAGYA